MRSLKNIVYSNLRKLAVIVMVLILLITVFFQILSVQRGERKNAEATFAQIEIILEKNTAELKAIEAEYRTTCYLNAETISYIIQHNPDIIGNVEEFRQLAYIMEVDEIHIFDSTGRIFTGTHPEYFDYTFDSGEQMEFFKPLLNDKKLWLCQDITPNTAEGKLVQYSALWSSDGQYIVQVGMYPDAVLATTEKNELSYIFSLLKGTPGVSLYAIDSDTGNIIGSTSGIDNGKSFKEVGFRASDIEKCPDGEHLTVNGVHTFAVFQNMDGTVIAYVVSSDQMYDNVLPYTFVLTLCLVIIAIGFVFVIQKFTDRYIINSISSINEKLRTVSEGNLEERVSVPSSLEFSELGTHINDMIQALLAGTDKISLVLNRTNMHIGVYEYNKKMKTVRFTDRLPQIFALSTEEVEELAGDYRKTEKFIDELRKNPMPNTENTYHFIGKTEKYIKLEEIKNKNDILGVVIDVTEDTKKLRHAETERDFDSLTGLYNRRGMEGKFKKLISSGEDIGNGALIMIDSDGLKAINDTYGHAVGDLYLKRHAELLYKVDAPKKIAARVGGDEFVLFIYGYDSDEAVQDGISALRAFQDSEKLILGDGTELTIRFSFGYQIAKEGQGYETMLASADEYMYNSKRIRKKLNAED